MSNINRIDISQLHSAQALASALEGAGELRVSKGTNTVGKEVVYLRERTFVESLKDFFGIDTESRQKNTDAALDLIHDFLVKYSPPGANSTQRHQTILNIRTEASRQKCFTGGVIAEEVKNFLASKNNVDPLKGGLVAASRNAKTGINLMSVSPTRVVADNALLRSTTVVTALLANPELRADVSRVQSGITLADVNRKSGRAQGDLKEQFNYSDQLLPTPSMVVMPDLKPNADSEGSPAIEPEQLKRMYAKALKGKSGTLVIEPFPDQFTRDKVGKMATFSKQGLQMMMEAIKDAVSDAAKNGKRLHVSIASENEDLIARLKSAFGNSNQLEDDDTSDSDDDNEPLVLDNNQVVLRAREMEALERFNKIFSSKVDDGKKNG